MLQEFVELAAIAIATAIAAAADAEEQANKTVALVGNANMKPHIKMRFLSLSLKICSFVSAFLIVNMLNKSVSFSEAVFTGGKGEGQAEALCEVLVAC